MMSAKFVCLALVIVLNDFSAFCVPSGLGIRFKDYVKVKVNQQQTII